ncbi:hypothetical protein SVIOM342S_06296 [Streptomyces violaceorubidus]
MIAKFLEERQGSSGPFVIDVKSTSLYESELNSDVVWAKTGHSYVKAKVAEAGAVAGFERSGHFFFSEPLGHGYDDACVAALALLWMLCSAKATGEEAFWPRRWSRSFLPFSVCGAPVTRPAA